MGRYQRKSEYESYEHHPVQRMNNEEYQIMSRLLRTQSKSHRVSAMQRQLSRIFSELFMAGHIQSFRTDTSGNFLVRKGEVKKGEHFPAVACHIDTVHVLVAAKDYVVSEWIDPFENRRQWFCDTGIGGDDKCGIFTAISLLMRSDIKQLKAFFYVDEEVGALGAKASVKSSSDWYDDVGYIIESDRRGSTDLIFAASGVKKCSEEFRKIVTEATEPAGFAPAYGTFTDVMKIQNDIKKSVMNISCGYYQPHTADEFIDESDMLAGRDAVANCITALGNKLYAYEAPVASYPSYGSYSGYNNSNTKTFKGTYNSKNRGKIDATYTITEYSTGKTYWWSFSIEGRTLAASSLAPDLELAMKQTLLRKWELIGKKKKAKAEKPLPPAPHTPLLTFPNNSDNMT